MLSRGGLEQFLHPFILYVVLVLCKPGTCKQVPTAILIDRMYTTTTLATSISRNHARDVQTWDQMNQRSRLVRGTCI